MAEVRTTDDDAVFKALADGGRRQLLDALRERDGRTLGDLCGVLPQLTRFGVMKHLAVLEAADLVLTLRAGRTKQHFLNPVPIRQLHDRWISRYAEPAVVAMVDLRARAEDVPVATADETEQTDQTDETEQADQTEQTEQARAGR